MTQAEFLRWIDFYAMYPFDDFHRFHRPAALVAGALGGGDMQARLEWLQPDKSKLASGAMNEADMNTLRAFGIQGKGR